MPLSPSLVNFGSTSPSSSLFSPPRCTVGMHLHFFFLYKLWARQNYSRAKMSAYGFSTPITLAAPHKTNLHLTLTTASSAAPFILIAWYLSCESTHAGVLVSILRLHLGENAFKMADHINDKIHEDIYFVILEVHWPFREGKVFCPKEWCVEIFWSEWHWRHHFRLKHTRILRRWASIICTRGETFAGKLNISRLSKENRMPWN